jgi:hypothetical protein
MKYAAQTLLIVLFFPLAIFAQAEADLSYYLPMM